MTTVLILLPRVSYRDQEITGPRLRGVLALLAGDLRTGCSSARLVEGLWPDEQPENPTKALQVLVSRARSQLGSDVIASTPTGYRLSLSEDQVDTSAVLLSASASAQHARAGDHVAALAHAEAGLALWDGAAREDIVRGDPVSALRAERASTYRSLVRARALALGRLARHGEAVEALTDQARERPRDEEVLLELLRCEAATAGPSAALARYDTYRRCLRDELGSDPGPALQAVHHRLLQGATPEVRHGVPHEPNPLLGRADDIAAVTNLLQSSRVASIVGAGGLGKTRLAHVVSRQAEQRVVHLVALAGVSADDDVPGEVASVLGVGESRRTSGSHPALPTDVVRSIVTALGSGPALLVLDNCENVVRGAAELVGALVSMTRDLHVLTTSRTPLGLSSESVYLLPELTLPTAVELFEQRARAARPGVDLPRDVVEELCDHLDGLPLAVELAAARTRAMSVAEIAHRLDDRFSLLRGGAPDTPPRHRTLHDVVDWSWNLLEPSRQAAMRGLSVFPGGFTVDAAQYLVGDGDVVVVLEHLVDQSLLTVTDTPSSTRFRMLETVREFSTAHREAADETRRATDRFLAWARDVGVAHHDSPFGAHPYPSMERIRAEQDNLVHAMRQGLARVDGATVAATSAVLGALWTGDANNARVATLTRESAWVLSHFRPEPAFVEVARTASALFTTNTFLFEGPRAVRSLVALRRLPPAPPDTVVRAIAIVLVAQVPDRSALRELCDSDEPLLAGVANGVASYYWENEGDLDGALVAAERMLDGFDRRATPWMRVIAHSRIGDVCVQVERGDEARRHSEAALLLLERAGAWFDPAHLQWGMMLAHLSHGAIDEAKRLFEQNAPNLANLANLADTESDADGATRTYLLGVRAEIALARGEVDTGLRLWRQAVDRMKVDEGPFDAPGMTAWTMEVEAVAVIAHAHHGRLDLVEHIIGELRRRLSAVRTDPGVELPSYLMGFPVCGAAVLALGMVDVARADDQRARTSTSPRHRSGPAGSARHRRAHPPRRRARPSRACPCRRTAGGCGRRGTGA